jgi:hypothetical protein
MRYDATLSHADSAWHETLKALCECLATRVHAANGNRTASPIELKAIRAQVLEPAGQRGHACGVPRRLDVVPSISRRWRSANTGREGAWRRGGR